MSSAMNSLDEFIRYGRPQLEEKDDISCHLCGYKDYTKAVSQIYRIQPCGHYVCIECIQGDCCSQEPYYKELANKTAYWKQFVKEGDKPTDPFYSPGCQSCFYDYIGKSQWMDPPCGRLIKVFKTADERVLCHDCVLDEGYDGKLELINPGLYWEEKLNEESVWENFQIKKQMIKICKRKEEELKAKGVMDSRLDSREYYIEMFW